MHIHTSDQASLVLGFGDYTCNWGLHIAGLYETEEERDTIIIGFLHAGDVAGDIQLYCLVERSAEDFKAEYGVRFPACRHHTADLNRFRLHPAREIYYPDGVFSPWAMDESLTAFYVMSQSEGPRNVRATAEMVWALEAIPGGEHLMAYESRLNYFIPGKPWISVCMYNLNRFTGGQIMDVLRTHPYTISNGVIMENPYYQDPDVWLKANAPQFLPEAMAHA